MSTKKAESASPRRQLLTELSDTMLSDGAYIAGETDRWFLLTVRGAKRSWDKTRDGLGAVGGYVTKKTWVSRLPGVRKKSPSERLRRAILVEAKRAGIRPDDPDFAAFAERIAVLLELVLDGSIAACAVDFEDGAESAQPDTDEHGAGPDDLASASAPSVGAAQSP